MKKVIVLVALSLVVLVTLLPVACTGSTAVDTTTTTPPTTTTTTTPPTTTTTTTYEDGFARVTCEEIHAVMEADPNWRSFAHLKPVDARDTYDYDRARVPFADNIPNILHSELATIARQNNLKILPRDSMLVFFDDTGGPMAVDLAQQLVDLNQELNLGFDIENIRILEGGMDRWLELRYPTSSAEGCGAV